MFSHFVLVCFAFFFGGENATDSRLHSYKERAARKTKNKNKIFMVIIIIIYIRMQNRLTYDIYYCYRCHCSSGDIIILNTHTKCRATANLDDLFRPKASQVIKVIQMGAHSGHFYKNKQTERDKINQKHKQ